MNREIALISHVAVRKAVEELKDAIANGSFAKVTETYRDIDKDLTAQINQARKFRNWVAHGRRDSPQNNVSPDDAFDRMRRYLEKLATLSDGS